MVSPEDILGIYHSRKDRLAPAHAIFRGIRAGILGDVSVALPELDKNEQPAVANLMLVGVTQTAGRIASTMPDPYYPPIRPGIDKSDGLARTRRERMLDLYDKVNLKTIMRRRAHHYLAYAASPMVIKPNPAYSDDTPWLSPVQWQLYDPLQTYAAEMPIGQVVPDDSIFTYTRTHQWIENRYGPGVLNALALSGRSPEANVTLLEYIDADTINLYALSDTVGVTQAPQGPLYGIVGQGTVRKPPGKPIVEVSVVKNRTGRPLCAVAGLIGLERPQSMYEGLVGLFQTQSKMMALEVIGMMRSIWPEEWAVTRPGETANIITQADPIAGILGEISGADIHINAPQPAQFGVNIVDRMERAQRVQGGIPAEYGGESATNTRTDKRGNSILSATIDYTIQAAHESFEQSMRAENQIAAEIEKQYFPGKKVFFSTIGQTTYTPADLWEPQAVSFVKYSHAGVDQQGLVVEGGQRLGIGTLSKRSFMEIDPLVDDPEQETERVRAEMLEAMLFQSLTGLAQQDPNYMTVIAQLDQQLREDKAPNIMGSWLALDKKYKDQQAQAQQQSQQAQSPDAAAAAQPGLAAPGAGQIPPPGADLSNLGSLLQTLKRSGRSPEPAAAGAPSQLQGATAGP